TASPLDTAASLRHNGLNNRTEYGINAMTETSTDGLPFRERHSQAARCRRDAARNPSPERTVMNRHGARSVIKEAAGFFLPRRGGHARAKRGGTAEEEPSFVLGAKEGFLFSRFLRQEGKRDEGSGTHLFYRSRRHGGGDAGRPAEKSADRCRQGERL